MAFYGNKLGISMPKTFEEDISKKGQFRYHNL